MHELITATLRLCGPPSHNFYVGLSVLTFNPVHFGANIALSHLGTFIDLNHAVRVLLICLFVIRIGVTALGLSSPTSILSVKILGSSKLTLLVLLSGDDLRLAALGFLYVI